MRLYFFTLRIISATIFYLIDTNTVFTQVKEQNEPRFQNNHVTLFGSAYLLD